MSVVNSKKKKYSPMLAAKKYFGDWSSKQCVLSKLTEQVVDMSVEALKLCILGIGKGHNIHLDCPEMYQTLRRIHEWKSLLPTGGYGVTMKVKSNFIVLAAIVNRLYYYTNNPSAKAAIEVKIRAKGGGSCLVSFVRGILIFFL